MRWLLILVAGAVVAAAAAIAALVALSARDVIEEPDPMDAVQLADRWLVHVPGCDRSHPGPGCYVDA